MEDEDAAAGVDHDDAIERRRDHRPVQVIRRLRARQDEPVRVRSWLAQTQDDGALAARRCLGPETAVLAGPDSQVERAGPGVCAGVPPGEQRRERRSVRAAQRLARAGADRGLGGRFAARTFSVRADQQGGVVSERITAWIVASSIRQRVLVRRRDPTCGSARQGMGEKAAGAWTGALDAESTIAKILILVLSSLRSLWNEAPRKHVAGSGGPGRT